MASSSRIDPSTAAEIDRLATAVAKDPRSKEFLPLADEYIKVGMWQEAAGVLEDGLKVYPGFVTAMAALGRVYDQLGQAVKAKAILEDVVRQRPDNLRSMKRRPQSNAASPEHLTILRPPNARRNESSRSLDPTAQKLGLTSRPLPSQPYPRHLWHLSRSLKHRAGRPRTCLS